MMAGSCCGVRPTARAREKRKASSTGLARLHVDRKDGDDQLRPPESGFERGIRQFGYLLLEVTFGGRPSLRSTCIWPAVLEAFLFSLALAVGLTPQQLPAIISTNLAHGANAWLSRK